MTTLQDEMAKIDGCDTTERISTELAKRYDEYMLKYSVEDKIAELIALKKKHKAVTWALPQLHEKSSRKGQMSLAPRKSSLGHARTVI